MNQKKIGSLAVIIGIFIFGFNFISMKFLADNMPPFALIFFRFAIASIFLWVVIGIKSLKGMPCKKISKEDRKLVIITGFLGISVFYCFQVMSLRYLTASLSALICATIPIFTLLIEVIIYKKKMTVFIIVNSLLSMLGVYLVINKDISEIFNSGEIVGCAYMILAVFSWIAYTIKTYNLQKKYDSIYLLTHQCLAGTILLFMFSIFDLPKVINVFQSTNQLSLLIGNLIFAGVVCSALGYFFYIYGMEKVGIGISSLYMNLIPVVTAVGSYFILGETMNKIKISGMVIVLFSVYAVNCKDWLENKRKSVNKEILNNDA